MGPERSAVGWQAFPLPGPVEVLKKMGCSPAAGRSPARCGARYLGHTGPGEASGKIGAGAIPFVACSWRRVGPAEGGPLDHEQTHRPARPHPPPPRRPAPRRPPSPPRCASLPPSSSNASARTSPTGSPPPPPGATRSRPLPQRPGEGLGCHPRGPAPALQQRPHRRRAHKIKLRKRQTYDKASFALLRKRTLIT